MDELFIKLYDLETYILNDVRDNFKRNQHLNTFDFFCIIIWKANRAKTKIAARLTANGKILEHTVKELTSKIYSAKDDKAKLKVLIIEYKFRLPMSSAILSVLYPDNFTVYDIRVCETLTDFIGIDNKTNFEKLWDSYSKYIQKVRDLEPENLTLRDKDRLLWGKSFFEQLNQDIHNQFKK